MVREPAVAGQFYASDFTELNDQIKKCFEAKLGPGDLPLKRTDRKIRAVVVPHAGYDFSGQCAAWAYKEIAESAFPDVFILMGPNHFGHGTGMSIEDWRTPFGIVKTDKDSVIGLKEQTSLKISEQNHLAEHSLEVQLPFLQFVNKDRIHDIKIVPIVFGRDVDYSEIGSQMAAYLKKSRKSYVFIISSDFTHYGPGYGYVPFASDVQERITALDKGAIDLILGQDLTGFGKYLNKTGITMCGYPAVLAFLSIFQAQKLTGSLLMHYLSGDLAGDYRNSVSYASILFK